MAQGYYDVFLSYARQDRPEWVEAMAETLHQRSFEVFLDAWEIGAGDVLVHELDRGILESRHGVLVLTRSYFDRPFVRAEYAAILQRTIEGRQWVIPILVDDVEVPPLLAAHVWVDFRGADGPEYDRKVEELARALQGKKAKDRPPRTGDVVAQPGTRYRPEGALRRTLRIEREKVALLTGDEVEGKHDPKPVDHALDERIWELGRARQRWFEAEEVPQKRGEAEAVVADASLQEACLAVGAALTRTFLDGAAGEALHQAVTKAEKQNASLELGLEIAEELRSLPWETLRIPEAGGAPGDPLALHPRVRLYRAASGDGPTAALAIPGPLRILMAIGSPETGGGELLDYEEELARILDAVEPAKKVGRAHVQVLHRGTVHAIRDALEAERFHVLHLSCHAGPGVLILETDDGEKDEVTADRLWKEALPADRGVPMVVLAGCATALDARKKRSEADGDEGEEALAGLAAELLDHGIPTVLAMQAQVSDHYATDLAGRLYRVLASHADPDPLDALARARKDAEQARRRLDPQQPEFQLAEWATPALYLRGIPQLLYDPAAPFQEIEEAPEAHFAPGVVVRKVGEFVGRRRDERLILKTLRKDRHAGTLIRGIGGVGKSTLAAEILTHLVADGCLVVSAVGETAPEIILEGLGKELLALTHAAGAPENHPLRQIAPQLRRPDADWSDRLDLLQRTILNEIPIVLLMDNFEDNLVRPDEPGADHTVRNQALANFLTAWFQSPGKSRLLVTCRYPFHLPKKADRRLEDHHLGPLSFAETRKLFWRLPALEALSAEDRLRAYRAVGGHPRALEYLDALLRGGEARFHDVELRLEDALENEGVKDARAWIRDRIGGNLDKALAETVTIAAGDVLLEGLLKLLDSTPYARSLLIGASVYRVPVDEVALDWQVGEEVEPEPDPQGEALRKRVNKRAEELKEQGEAPIRENFGLTEAEWQAYDEVIRRTLRPPIRVPEGVSESHHLLTRLGLLSRIPAGEAAGYLVHRWTASALENEGAPETLQDAHRRAARFWRWRVENISQSKTADIDQLLEARYHHHSAGEIEEAIDVTKLICSQLDTWGAYSREEQLCREVLEWVPEGSREAAGFSGQLGDLEMKRGSYERAAQFYMGALEILEQLDEPSARARCLHALGMVDHSRGSHEGALGWYGRSLALRKKIGDEHGMADSYHQIGMLHQDQGRHDEALGCHEKALSIYKRLGETQGVAGSYFQIGIVAQHRGGYQEAENYYRRALAIVKEMEDKRGLGLCYHQLGNLAYLQGDDEQAKESYRRALEISESLGDRPGIAAAYHQLGKVAESCWSLKEAANWYKKSMAISSEIGDRAALSSSVSQIGALLAKAGRAEEAVPWTLRSLAIRLEISVPEIRSDLFWLGKQREVLGVERFGEILREHLDEEAARRLLRMMKEFEEPG